MGLKRKISLAVCASLGVAGLVAPASAAPQTPSGGSELNWTRCTGKPLKGLWCAELSVPRDYSNPTAGRFSLAVVKARATGPRKARIGTLFFNPGGPGTSGVALARTVADALPGKVRKRFDFVTWDPRGVGQSAGLTECSGGQYSLPAAGPVDWDAVLTSMRDAQGAANRACAANYPDIVPYISTNATVKDLDALRAAVGDEQLTYWGTSYGTRIGYVYAHDYPDRVRAMLLTSSVDPNSTWPGFVLNSGTNIDTALGLLFESFPGSKRNYRRSARALDATPVRLPSGQLFTRWHVGMMLAGGASDESKYPDLAAFLATVDSAVNGRGAAKRSARKQLDRSPWPTSIQINGGATPFIGCLDYPQRMDAAQQNELGRRIRAQAPITGAGASQALVYCEGVDVTPDPVPVDFVNWKTPMLIIGSTRDALTPYAWTADMARAFKNSRVVTYVGASHTPYLTAGSKCVDRHGSDYLISLRRPAVDVACPNSLR